jgi:hypothetical protein
MRRILSTQRCGCKCLFKREWISRTCACGGYFTGMGAFAPAQARTMTARQEAEELNVVMAMQECVYFSGRHGLSPRELLFSVYAFSGNFSYLSNICIVAHAVENIRSRTDPHDADCFINYSNICVQPPQLRLLHRHRVDTWL